MVLSLGSELHPTAEVKVSLSFSGRTANKHYYAPTTHLALCWNQKSSLSLSKLC